MSELSHKWRHKWTSNSSFFPSWSVAQHSHDISYDISRAQNGIPVASEAVLHIPRREDLALKRLQLCQRYLALKPQAAPALGWSMDASENGCTWIHPILPVSSMR